MKISFNSMKSRWTKCKETVKNLHVKLTMLSVILNIFFILCYKDHQSNFITFDNETFFLEDVVRDCVSGRVVGQMSEGQKPEKKPGGLYRPYKLLTDVYGSMVFLEEEQEVSTTNEIISNLNVIVNAIKKEKGEDYVVKILDVPCGDLQWMPRFLDMRKGDVNYTGMDNDDEAIELHKLYYTHKGWKFIYDNILKADRLPKYDIIFSRLFVQTVSSKAALKMLELFSQSGSSYLFISTFPLLKENPSGYFNLAPYNLELPPISLSHPLCYGVDGPRKRLMYMGLWQLPLDFVPDCTSARSSGPIHTCSPMLFDDDFFQP